MNLKVYEKTRYQNIYRHKKNKNYVIEISKPIKTSVSKIDNLKIYDMNTAITIRDTYSKTSKISSRGTVSTLWSKYMYDCEFVQKLKPRTLKKKRNIYNKYIKNFYPDKLALKISEKDCIDFLSSKFVKDATDKQKNHILKELKTFFSWCKFKKYISTNPTLEIQKIKVPKPVIEFWEVEEFIKFQNTISEDLKSPNYKIRRKANLIRVLSYIGMGIGDRIGETRILRFCWFNKNTKLVYIGNDIDDTVPDFESTPKTDSSTRYAAAPKELFDVVDDYKKFMINEYDLKIDDKTFLFVNPKTMKPYSDTNLRKHFNYYIKKAGVPPITMYALRHSYVVNMLEQGFELYQISENLGHTDYATTINYYGSISRAIKSKVSKGAENIFQK